MGIKTFLKRFVAAYVDAASEQLSKDRRGHRYDLSNSTSEQIDSLVMWIRSRLTLILCLLAITTTLGLDEPT